MKRSVRLALAGLALSVIAGLMPLASLEAQACATATKFRVAATPNPTTIAAPTITQYTSGASTASSVVTIEACCPSAGGGNDCAITISSAAGSPDLTGVTWRLLASPVSIPASSRCIAAMPSVTPGVDNVLNATPKEVFRMVEQNNQSPCIAQIEFRATGLQFSTHTSGNTYTRTANFTIAKT